MIGIEQMGCHNALYMTLEFPAIVHFSTIKYINYKPNILYIFFPN